MKTDEVTGSKNVKVRLISQKTFDEMNGDEKTFYAGLIKNGRAKITSDADKPKDDTPRVFLGMGQDPFTLLRGRNVELKLNNGDVIIGFLTDAWAYEIAMNTVSGRILILKHAIMTVKEGGNHEIS
jgi:sRNA-binding regulator protein Hfq